MADESCGIAEGGETKNYGRMKNRWLPPVISGGFKTSVIGSDEHTGISERIDMSYNMQKLAELFKCIYDNTSDKFIDSEKQRRIKILGGAGTVIQFKNAREAFTFKVPDEEGKTLRIINEGVDAIELFIKELQSNKEIKEYVSPKGIEKQIEESLRHNYGNINNLEVFIKTAIIKPITDNIKTWEVYVPVVNLKIEQELTLGDVSFVLKDIATDTIIKFMNKGDYRFAGDTKEKEENNRIAFVGQISQWLNGFPAFAKVKCKSHSSNVEAVATNKVFMAINSIRAFLHILCPYYTRELWGLPQEITSGLSIIVSLDHSEKHGFNFNPIKTGAINQFVLGPSSIDKLQKICHLEVIQKILAKADDKKNCLENAIIDSLQAIGKGIVAPTTDMRFIEYITAIERLLIKNGEEATADKFTDRLVFALTSDRDKRMELVSRSKELYHKRSRMLHTASYFDIYEEDECDAENWALNLAIMALGKSKEGYTHKRFCEEIINRKYQGSNYKE